MTNADSRASALAQTTSCAFNPSIFASSSPSLLLSTSLVFSPSRGGARYSLIGVPENVSGLRIRDSACSKGCPRFKGTYIIRDLTRLRNSIKNAQCPVPEHIPNDRERRDQQHGKEI